MSDLLCRIFVKNHEDVTNPDVRRRYGTFVSIVCIIVNIVLASGKFVVGLLTASVSIQADAINNFSDAGASVISLVSFKISGKPADRGHPFGHARIEYVASMIVSFFILMIGFELVKSSIDKMINPSETEFSVMAIIVLSISILGKLWICLFNRHVGKRIDSGVMRATAADSLSDVLSTLAVLICTLVSHFTSFDLDAYVGIAVAVFIMFTGVKILNETKNSILGEAPVDEVLEGINRIIGEYPDALGVHDMMIHNYGPGHTIASLHVEVDGTKDIFESHDMIDNIEKRIRDELSIICTIHLDPILANDELGSELLTLVKGVTKEIDESISVHDFRYVKGVTHTNLIFDIVLPFESSREPDDVVLQISDSVKALEPSYNTVITVDRG